MEEFNSQKDGFLPRGNLSWWDRTVGLRRRRLNVRELWKTAYGDLKDDLKRTRWLRGFGWFAAVLWLFGLIATACVIGIMTLSSTETACQPDGQFRLHPDEFTMWSSSGFFQITLGGGELTFTEAKVIDIVWDIVVGRGGQFVLGYISLKVFRQYLTTCMEVRPITFQTFRTIFLDKEISLPSTCGIMKSLLWQRRLQSKTAVAFMILTMIFTLLFPTIASAMSGYDANVGSYLTDYDNNFVPFRKFSRVLYIVHDGRRINQTDDYQIVTPDESSTDPVLSGHDEWCKTQRERNYPAYLWDKSCMLKNAVSDYVWANGLGGGKNEPSIINYTAPGGYDPTNLDPPTLNISAYLTPGDSTLGGYGDGKAGVTHWFKDDQKYPLDYVEQFGRCQTIGTYRWGFSFLQLFVCIILLFLWTVGIYVLWLRAHFTLKLRNHDSRQTSGPHKAILELSAAMEKQLDLEDTDAAILIEEQLDERINNELKGGAIFYASAYPLPAGYSFRKGTKEWIKREKWWLVVLFVATTFVSTTWMLAWWLGSWSWGIWGSVILAKMFGTTAGSRWLIGLFGGIISAIIICALAIAGYS